MITTLLLDLDDTLIFEADAVTAALRSTARQAESTHGVNPDSLVTAVRRHAQAIWTAAPTAAYCDAIGISSWEGLSGDFTGEDSNLKALQRWAPEYRNQVWSRALQDHGVRSEVLAKELAIAHVQGQPDHWKRFPEAERALTQLQASYTLAMITNGAPAIQRGKIAATNLDSYFRQIVVSGEVGVGKPSSDIFKISLQRLDAAPDESVMVGNSLTRDVVGAQGAGIRAVWMNRTGDDPATARPDAQISRLDQLSTVITANQW